MESLDNALMSIFGYIDGNNEKVRKMAENIYSPALGRSAKDLESTTFLALSMIAFKRYIIL
jgi:hypothetical protein